MWSRVYKGKGKKYKILSRVLGKEKKYKKQSRI